MRAFQVDLIDHAGQPLNIGQQGVEIMGGDGRLRAEVAQATVDGLERVHSFKAAGNQISPPLREQGGPGRSEWRPWEYPIGSREPWLPRVRAVPDSRLRLPVEAVPGLPLSI